MLDCCYIENYCNAYPEDLLIYTPPYKMVGPLSDRKHVNCLGQYDVMNPESLSLVVPWDIVSLCVERR